MYLEEACSDYVVAAAETARRVHTSERSGDILVFLPGQEDIRRAIELVNDAAPSGERPLACLPLYAQLPWKQQLQALSPLRPQRDGVVPRKCIFATNIAETSLTIEGIVYVIDSGFVKVRLLRSASARRPRDTVLILFARRSQCMIPCQESKPS